MQKIISLNKSKKKSSRKSESEIYILKTKECITLKLKEFYEQVKALLSSWGLQLNQAPQEPSTTDNSWMNWPELTKFIQSKICIMKYVYLFKYYFVSHLIYK